jgi:hypothetical protein
VKEIGVMFKKKNNHEAVKTFVRDYFIRVLPRVLDESKNSHEGLKPWEVSADLITKIINEAVMVFDQIEEEAVRKYEEFRDS